MLPEVEELLRWFDEGERAEVLAIAEAADIAARETFGPFNDEESPFFEADGYSPEGRGKQSLSESPTRARVS